MSDLAVWSASLPAILGVPARPWNGRALTLDERAGALTAFARDILDGGTAGSASQAAFEWLSEHA